jgi:hypothetical protein
MGLDVLPRLKLKKLLKDFGQAILLSGYNPIFDDEYQEEFNSYEAKFITFIEELTMPKILHGLYDKNDKPIQAGDILGGKYKAYFISWCDDCCSYQLHLPDGQCAACVGGSMQWHEFVDKALHNKEEIEIIGSIYN